jgi:hypothetical protein
MEYLSVQQISTKWKLAPRTIRFYCQTGKIWGAKLMGKTWIIPEDATKPTNYRSDNKNLCIMSNEKSKNIVIVGGGISGVFAAIRIKEKHPSYKVSIFEKNNKLLRKIYATGNGRCNFANQGNLNNKYNHESFVLPIINAFSSLNIVEYFERIGIKSKSVNELLYPLSDTAETVALMLNRKVEELKIKVHLEESMIDYSSNALITDKGSYHFDNLIIASGGKASPQFGSDGSIFSMLKNHGYSLIVPKPSLCPIKVKENVYLVEGLRAKVYLTLLIDGKLKHKEDGELLFKKDGLSGIAIFNFTHFINREKNMKRINICVDFAPNHGQIMPNQYVEFLHPRLANYLAKNNLDIHKTIFTFKGLYDFPNAQVSSGGLSIKEVSETLESKKEKNVYFIGEVLDVDAICGGFNIMWALASAEKVSNNLGDYGKEK